MKNWHRQTKEEIFKELQTSENGLSQKQAEKKLSEIGLNEIVKKKKTPEVLNFLKQFNSPLIYILFVAMIISFIFDHLVDAYVILAIVLINASIGYIQERKAERAIEALKKIVVSYAKVYRGEKLIKIPARELVPGDIILVDEGDKIPADARLINIKNFRTQESSLTGESFPVDKNLNLIQNSVDLVDKTNMVFMGTFAVSGQAKAIVVETGSQTEIGKVAESIKKIIQPKVHFQKKVDQLAIQMAIFAMIGAGLTFIIGYFIRGLEFFEIFLFTIASLVSGIPEGLPAVLIIVLAIGARRMAKKNAIVRYLPAVETLGVATIIATDKTGTLTQNSMMVEKIITSENEIDISGEGWKPIGEFSKNKKRVDNLLENSELQKIISISSLCNKGNLLKKKGNYEILGDPTEVALLVLAKKAGIDKDSKKVIDDLPFNADLKFRASLIKEDSKKQIYSVGAFEKILEISSYYIKNNKKIKLDLETKKMFLKKAEILAKKGMRVLALSYKDVPNNVETISKKDVNNLIFACLVGMKDPPRAKVKESIKKAKNAGIRIIMKTGDHKETAIAIAKEIGLANGKVKAITESELEKLSDSQFKKIVKEINIFARITPKMKMKIVKTLQEQGEIVAMTGDGVNDAPALKQADIGISMGIIGTDVARETSSIVLSNDNFSSIVDAIEEGRTVFRNVRRTSFFLVTTNVAEHVTIVSSLIIGMPLPMIPIQILYLNLVTDGVNEIGLAIEPTHEDVLKEAPRDKKQWILNKELIPFLIITAGLMVLVTIPIFNYFLPHSLEKARTAAFVSMSMFQLFNVFNMRSIKQSLFKLGVFSNKWIIYGLIISFLMMIGVIYLPFISGIFQFIPLSFFELISIIALTSSVFIAGEIYKMVRYKRKS